MPQLEPAPERRLGRGRPLQSEELGRLDRLLEIGIIKPGNRDRLDLRGVEESADLAQHPCRAARQSRLGRSVQYLEQLRFAERRLDSQEVADEGGLGTHDVIQRAGVEGLETRANRA